MTRHLALTKAAHTPEPSRARAAGSRRNDEEPKHRYNILLVDDRPDNLSALEAVLESPDHTLVRATTGEEALKCLLKDDFALILLDVQMPGLDGFETARIIKQLEKTRYIPIIFLTGVSTEKRHMFQGYSAGAVDYVVKPFDPAVLRSKVGVFIDLERKSSALKESEERFRSAFDHAPIGVALVTIEGRWLSVNRSFCEITGYPEDRLKSRDVYDIVHPDDVSRDRDFARRMLAGELRSYHREKRYLHAEGYEVYVLESVSLVHDAHGLPLHSIFQIADITERKRLEAFKTQFIDNAAHELRSPLTTIAGVAAMLTHERLGEEEFERMLEALTRQSQRARELINNLLDLSILERGLTISLQPLRLSSAAAGALLVEPAPEGATVTVRVPDHLCALADPLRLEQILANLLTNAYRYGGSSITLTATEERDGIVLSVKDDGPGVPPSFALRMFDPFARGPAVGDKVGSGLGLAIVRQLVDALGGTVWYEPGVPHGACFKVGLRRPS
jgi:PAS domain S-box-containing protein